MIGLLMAVLFAAWSWLRPYAWGCDPAARCKVVGACKVTRTYRSIGWRCTSNAARRVP
jgi:hypothetical protein